LEKLGGIKILGIHNLRCRKFATVY